MSDNNGVANVGAGQANPAEDLKGKGKAVEPQSHDMSMDEDDDSSDEEDGAEDEVWLAFVLPSPLRSLTLNLTLDARRTRYPLVGFRI